MATARLRQRNIGADARGFTMVELMIALLIGLIVIAGGLAIFMSSRQTYRTTESVSRVRENAQFAFTRIARDIRMMIVKRNDGRPNRSYQCIEVRRSSGAEPAERDHARFQLCHR